MGTSHRHTPTVVGEPNWGKASASVTGVANAVAAADELQNNPPDNLSQKEIEKKQANYEKRIVNHTHKAVYNLIKAAGGRKSVARGQSRAIGISGLSSIASWINTMHEIQSHGLHTWLQNHGIPSLEGKSSGEIIEFISNYLDDHLTSLDDTAAKEALEHIMGLVEQKLDDDLDSFDIVLNSILTTEEVNDYIDQFFGIYIYSHLSQDFSEKLEKMKGTETMADTMTEIKELILDDVRRGYNKKPASQIDWNGQEGMQFIKEEFERIILILSGNED